MLNKNTRQILNQLAPISSSMIISYPITTVIDGKHIQAYVDMEKMEEEEFKEVGFTNINEFTSVVNILGDPTISADSNGVFTIEGDGQRIKYNSSNIGILESECRMDPTLLSRIKNNTNVASFELDSLNLAKIKKMSGTLTDLTTLEIKATVDSDVEVKTTGDEDSSNNYVLKLQGTVNEDTNMIMSMNLINKLPSSSYSVSIYKSPKGNKVAVFDSINAPGLSIVVSTKSRAGV